MSQQTDIIRDKRQHWAAPGGSHDRKVKFLAVVLPGLVGVVTAAMVVGPLFARGEISFLLDRTKVAMTKERVRVADAMYRGEDNQGRPFTVTAGNAMTVSGKEPVGRPSIRFASGPEPVEGEAAAPEATAGGASTLSLSAALRTASSGSFWAASRAAG